MKIKQRPEDFLVEELLDLKLAPEGRHAVFRVEKRSINTLDAVADLARILGIHRSEVGFAGLKDKHSLSIQHFSAPEVAGRDFTGASLKARFLGLSHLPVSSKALLGNRFELTVRDLSRRQAADFASSVTMAAETGLPNYFDEQRFGSARHGQGFLAEKMVRGDFEAALKLTIAAPSRKDRSGIKAEKNLVARQWGKWEALRESVRHDPQRRIVAHLCAHPGDFTGALNLLDAQMMSLYVHAWQSLLWNRIAARVVAGTVAEGNLLRRPYKWGEYLFQKSPDARTTETLKDLEIPLPSQGMAETAAPVAEAVEAVLSAEGLLPGSFNLSGVKAFFKKGARKLLFFPAELHVGTPQPDELDPGRRKLRVSFVLPPGSYATIVVKRASIPI